jgi:hypothetical protein
MNSPLESVVQPLRNKPLLATQEKRCCLVLNPPHKSENQKTVMVLGVERGGTSMAAGVLRALGVNMGDRAGLNHEDPQFLIDDVEKLSNRIAARNKRSDVWGFKVPKLVHRLTFFEKNLRNPYYIIVFRNLLAIADSWQQRGAGSSIDVMDRAFEYYNLIMAHCRQTNRPVLMLNYERAVGSDAGKEETARALAAFLGLDLSDQSLARAVGMITGDGKGYLNLPEHFFAVTATTEMPERRPLELSLRTPELVGRDGWIDFDTQQKKLIFTRPGNEQLPPAFWLRVELDVSRGVDLSSCPLRIYFDFIGALFPAHCARPTVQRGLNYLYVETSGMATALAFGPLQVPAQLRIEAVAYQAMPDDAELVSETAIAENLRRPDARR